MCPTRMRSLVTALTVTALFSFSLCTIGCGIFGTTQPVSRATMVDTARFENKTIADVENRLMDNFDAGLLDPSLHTELDPYVKACRSAANEMTRIANTPGASRSAFDLALDQFVAALAPLTDANAKAVQTKRVARSAALQLKASPTSRPTNAGTVPPSVTHGYDALRFNAPPGR
jgi:hypothetical protein